MYEESIPSFEKAIALDPRFAMAYRKMAVAYGNAAKWEERTKYMQKALELSDRLTERERLLIEGGYFGSSFPTYDKAIASYDRLIALYPGSNEAQTANVNLGGIYLDMDEWDMGIEYNQAALEADTDIRIPYTNLTLAYMAKGDYGKAEEVLEGAVDRFSSFLRGHWDLAKVYAFQGKFDLAMEQVAKAAAIDPTYTPAQFYHIMWDFGKAEEEYVKWLEHVDPDTHLLARQRLHLLYQTLGKFEEAENQILLAVKGAKDQENDGILLNYSYNLAYFYLKAGRAENALDAAEACERIDLSGPRDTAMKIRNLELKGWIYAEMDRIDEALKAAEEIKDLVDASLYGKLIRHYHFLMGMIQRQNKDYPKAIESIQLAATLQPHPWSFVSFELPYRYYLALAHFESGDLRTAADSFEELIAFIPCRNEFGDLYAVSNYRLGKIYEQLNDPTMALANYQKFLDLWKDADPALPSLADARERVAALQYK
jgi:tetratricopeptide (TPR) repeat protein